MPKVLLDYGEADVRLVEVEDERECITVGGISWRRSGALLASTQMAGVAVYVRCESVEDPRRESSR